MDQYFYWSKIKRKRTPKQAIALKEHTKAGNITSVI